MSYLFLRLLNLISIFGILFLGVIEKRSQDLLLICFDVVGATSALLIAVGSTIETFKLGAGCVTVSSYLTFFYRFFWVNLSVSFVAILICLGYFKGVVFYELAIVVFVIFSIPTFFVSQIVQVFYTSSSMILWDFGSGITRIEMQNVISVKRIFSGIFKVRYHNNQQQEKKSFFLSRGWSLTSTPKIVMQLQEKIQRIQSEGII